MSQSTNEKTELRTSRVSQSPRPPSQLLAYRCALWTMATSAIASDPSNPGNVLASAVDAEVAKYRQLQEELQRLQSDMQIYESQLTENRMVQQELDLVDEASRVYKQIGPVLVLQDVEDARDTVKKRLDFIGGEKTKLESKINELEQKGIELSQTIQKMQRQLQETTAQAVQSVAQEHYKK